MAAEVCGFFWKLLFVCAFFPAVCVIVTLLFMVMLFCALKCGVVLCTVCCYVVFLLLIRACVLHVPFFLLHIFVSVAENKKKATTSATNIPKSNPTKPTSSETVILDKKK